MIAQIFFLTLWQRSLLNGYVESGHFLFLISMGIFFILVISQPAFLFLSLFLKTMYQVKGFFLLSYYFFMNFFLYSVKFLQLLPNALFQNHFHSFSCVATASCFQVALSVLLFNLLLSGLLY